VVTLFSKRERKDGFIIVDKFSPTYLIEKLVNVQAGYLKENLGLALAEHLSIISKIRNAEKSIDDYYKVENPCSVSEAYEIKSILVDSSLTKITQKRIFCLLTREQLIHI
jgi:hypothetical protein